jgi:hypothetical protein
VIPAIIYPNTFPVNQIRISANSASGIAEIPNRALARLAGMNDLNCYGPSDGGIETAVDDSHGSTTQFFQKLVGPNRLHR